jgi:cytochrome c553
LKESRMKIGFVLLIALYGFGAASAKPQEPAPNADIGAERIAVGVCTACHGNRGISGVSRFPILAGQGAGYLAAQLKAFKEHSRADADAQSFMWGIAGSLEDSQIESLSRYYAAQPPRSPILGNPVLSEQGQRIFEKGIETQHVPPCAACHGQQAQGSVDIPRLAGQHAEYFTTQMRAFQSGDRASSTMRAIAMSLSVAELESLAAYIGSISE